MAMKKIRVQMRRGQSDTAYIKLPGHPDKPKFGIVCKTIDLVEVIANYKGPRVMLNFNKDGKLIGIEILA